VGEEIVATDGFTIIGERINATRKFIRKAVKERDVKFVQNEARKQTEAGATYIDCNAGANPATEADDLKWLVETVQGATDLPLCLDSANPDALRSALRLVQKTPIINSITTEPGRAEAIMPLVVERNTFVVALCMTESGIPIGADERVKAAEAMVKIANKAGVSVTRMLFDPAVTPVSTNPQEAMAIMQAVWRIMHDFPGANTTCGLSNISFGLPNRNVLNRNYLSMLMGAGLNSAIIDPTEPGMMATVIACNAIRARDEYCMHYIQAARDAKLD
jgi:cobalamin-dependent methionine synthase I